MPVAAPLTCVIGWCKDSRLVPIDGVHAKEELDLVRNLAWLIKGKQALTTLTG